MNPSKVKKDKREKKPKTTTSGRTPSTSAPPSDLTPNPDISRQVADMDGESAMQVDQSQGDEALDLQESPAEEIEGDADGGTEQDPGHDQIPDQDVPDQSDENDEEYDSEQEVDWLTPIPIPESAGTIANGLEFMSLLTPPGVIRIECSWTDDIPHVTSQEAMRVAAAMTSTQLISSIEKKITPLSAAKALTGDIAGSAPDTEALDHQSWLSFPVTPAMDDCVSSFTTKGADSKSLVKHIIHPSPPSDISNFAISADNLKAPSLPSKDFNCLTYRPVVPHLPGAGAVTVHPRQLTDGETTCGIMMEAHAASLIVIQALGKLAKTGSDRRQNPLAYITMIQAFLDMQQAIQTTLAQGINWCRSHFVILRRQPYLENLKTCVSEENRRRLRYAPWHRRQLFGGIEGEVLAAHSAEIEQSALESASYNLNPIKDGDKGKGRGKGRGHATHGHKTHGPGRKAQTSSTNTAQQGPKGPKAGIPGGLTHNRKRPRRSPSASATAPAATQGNRERQIKVTIQNNAQAHSQKGQTSQQPASKKTPFRQSRGHRASDYGSQ